MRGARVRVAAAVLATAGVLALVPPAHARDEAEIVPGERVFGEVEAGAETQVAIRGTAGMLLSVEVVTWRGDTLEPRVSLEGPSGAALDLGGSLAVHRTRRKVRIRKFPLPSSGVFHLVVGTAPGTSGGFDVATSATRATRLRGRGTLLGVGTPADLAFEGLPGDVVRLKVRPKEAVVADLESPDASRAVIGSAGAAGPLTLLQLGRHVFGIEGAAGPYRYDLKIAPVRASKAWKDLADLLPTGSISGALLVEGQAAGPGKRAASSRRRRGGDAVRTGELVVALPGSRTPGEVVAALEADLPGVRFEHLHSTTDEGPHLVRAVGIRRGRGDRRDEGRTRSLARATRRAGGVLWAQANGVCSAAREPNDDLYPTQRDLADMRLPKAWDATVGDASVRVAVVDTGIWQEHPDLVPRLSGGFDFILDPFTSQDGDGLDADPRDDSHEFHGTHVAGTIGAASNNRVGVTGVMWSGGVVPIRVLGRGGSGSFYDVSLGVRWAAGLAVNGAPANPDPADVINLSLGGFGTSNDLQSAVSAALAAGVTVVAAAGNDATSDPFIPASYPGVISVSAAAPDLRLASYSNFGSTISVAAPGGDQNRGLAGILSTFVDPSRLTPTYRELQGTSMAAPHVAGVAGLLLSVAPDLTPAQVKSILESTAVDLGAAGRDDRFGAGLVDADAAVRAALATSPSVPSLAVFPQALELGPGLDAATVHLRNDGSGTITVTSVTASVDGGGAWLSAAATGTTLPTSVEVTADRASLPIGVHTGRVAIVTSAGSATVPVRLVRTEVSDVGSIVVAAVNPDGSIAAQTATTKAQGYAFEIGEVPFGDYHVVAYADRNGDGVIGRVDEWFGRWPVGSAPSPVRIDRNQLAVGGIDFSLTRQDERFQFDGAGGGPIVGALAVRVTDAETGAPIAGASVHVGPATYSATTDSRGRAVITAPIQGGQTVTVAAGGYGTLTQVGSDAQYQSFALAPRAAPQTFDVDVVVDGLGFADDLVYVQAGDSLDVTVHDGFDGFVAQTLTVERRSGEIPVWALVYDLDGNPVKIALDTIDGASTPDGALVVLDAFAPSQVWWELTDRTVNYPSANFQPVGADLYGYAGLYWDSSSTLILGLENLAPAAPSTLRWISLGDLDPEFPSALEVTAVDAAGRSSTHWASGTIDTMTVGSPLTLRSPPTVSAPGNGASVPGGAASFSVQGTAGAQVHAIEIEDDGTGVAAWTVFLPPGATGFDLPSIPSGGLSSGRTYRWRARSLFVSDFDYDDYLDDALLLHLTDVATSAPRTFSVP